MDVSSCWNVQSGTGRVWWAVQKSPEFAGCDLASSPELPQNKWQEIKAQNGWENAIFSGEMNARIERPFKTVAGFEKAVFGSTFPYSRSGVLVFMDASSFNCNSGAINIREVNEQRREIGRQKGMSSHKWISGGLTITSGSSVAQPKKT